MIGDMHEKHIRNIAEDITEAEDLFAGIDLHLVASRYAKQSVDKYIKAKELEIDADQRVALIMEVYKITAEADLETITVAI